MTKLEEAAESKIAAHIPLGHIRTGSDFFQEIQKEWFVKGALWLLEEAKAKSGPDDRGTLQVDFDILEELCKE